MTRARRPHFSAAINRARSGKAVEHDLAPPRAVADRVGNERHRLHGRVHGKLVHPAGLHGVDPGIVPHVRAIAAGVANPLTATSGLITNLETIVLIGASPLGSQMPRLSYLGVSLHLYRCVWCPGRSPGYHRWSQTMRWREASCCFRGHQCHDPSWRSASRRTCPFLCFRSRALSCSARCDLSAFIAGRLASFASK